MKKEDEDDALIDKMPERGSLADQEEYTLMNFGLLHNDLKTNVLIVANLLYEERLMQL